MSIDLKAIKEQFESQNQWTHDQLQTYILIRILEQLETHPLLNIPRYIPTKDNVMPVIIKELVQNEAIC